MSSDYKFGEILVKVLVKVDLNVVHYLFKYTLFESHLYLRCRFFSCLSVFSVNSWVNVSVTFLFFYFFLPFLKYL